MITERPLLLELLASVGMGRVLAIVDYNAATEAKLPYYCGHLDCLMDPGSTHYGAYMKRYQGIPSQFIGIDVVMFDSWEEWKSYDWQARHHTCSICGGHLSNPPQHLTTNTDSAIMYTQSSAPP